MKRGCGKPLLRNLGAELAALGQAALVRGQVDNQAVRRHLGARLDGALLPVAHPLSVAPVVGAEQHDLFAGEAALQLAEERLKLAFLQHLASHWMAALRQVVLVRGF